MLKAGFRFLRPGTQAGDAGTLTRMYVDLSNE